MGYISFIIECTRYYIERRRRIRKLIKKYADDPAKITEEMLSEALDSWVKLEEKKYLIKRRFFL